MSFVRLWPKEKGRFRTLLSVSSNLANLNPSTEVMQLERPRGWIISRPFINYLINLWYSGCVMYNITRRGLACVAYPYLEAMREPDDRDRHGGIDSHVFFISHHFIIIILTLNLGVHRHLLNFKCYEE